MVPTNAVAKQKFIATHSEKRKHEQFSVSVVNPSLQTSVTSSLVPLQQGDKVLASLQPVAVKELFGSLQSLDLSLQPVDGQIPLPESKASDSFTVTFQDGAVEEFSLIHNVPNVIYWQDRVYYIDATTGKALHAFVEQSKLVRDLKNTVSLVFVHTVIV